MRVLKPPIAGGVGHAGWIDVALSAGYYDQAHFIRDFQAFSGMTPSAYYAARTAFANHVTFLQSDPH